MPEFEEIKPNPNLHKEGQNYQPSKGKTTQDDAPSTPPSNMRGRWKRSSRGPTPKPIAKDEPQSHRPNYDEDSSHSKEKIEESFAQDDYEIEDREHHEDRSHREDREPRDHDDYEYEDYDQEPAFEKEERSPKTHSSHKKPKEEKPFKVTSRKDVFIPKTKQDSERHRKRTSSASSQKSSLWQKILAFFGLATPAKKHSSEHKSYSKHSDSRGSNRSGSHNRRPYPQKRHSGSGQQRHRSGPPPKQDKKSND